MNNHDPFNDGIELNDVDWIELKQLLLPEEIEVISGTITEYEKESISNLVAIRDGYDWRCSDCINAALECRNGDIKCPYRQQTK